MPRTFAETQIATSMFVSPMKEKMVLTPGEVYEGTIDVANANTSKYDLEYHVSVGSYNLTKNELNNDDYGAVDTTIRSNYNRMVDWITIDKPEGIVTPNGTETVVYRINVPKDAPAGSQYATLLVTDKTDIPENMSSDDGTSNVMIESRIQMVVSLFANVTGETIREGSISENTMPSFLTNGPLTATSMARNDGNIYTDAEYVLQVWPLFSSEEICTNEENPETSLVLPETERYHTQTCDLPTMGIFKAKQTVSIFGKTSITEKLVIICPIWLLFIIIFVIIALIIWIIIKIRSRGKAGAHAEA